MRICCTKKLLDEAGIIPENGQEEVDLFCWSAHLITVNRRKTIVIVNDSNRFGFILHGLKAKDLKNLNGLILEGIRTSLLDDRVKEEIVAQYLQTAGGLVFTKTRGPKYVARLNKACELVEIFNDKLDPDVLYQTIAAQMMNRDFIKVDKKSEHEYIYDLLHKDFEQFAGEKIFRCEAVDLIVKLNLGSSAAWRRIVTPSNISFKQLHAIIQVSFDWKESHLHEFEIFDQDGRCIMSVISENEEPYEHRQDCSVSLDKDVRLLDYVHKGFKILYRYDYGDNWEHEIINQGIINDYDKNSPACLMGEGNAPPEDVGGILGYKEFLKIMADPRHEEYKSTRQWAQSQWYKDFDIDLVNRRLKNVLRYSL